MSDRVDPCYKHDRTTNTWSLLGNMNRPRGWHAAAPLLGGSVLWVTGKYLNKKIAKLYVNTRVDMVGKNHDKVLTQ